MTRSSKKPTVNQLNERIEHLEGAMAEAQQFISMIAKAFGAFDEIVELPLKPAKKAKKGAAKDEE